MKNVNVVGYFGVLLLVVVWLFFIRNYEKASGDLPKAASPVVAPTVTAGNYYPTRIFSVDGTNSLDNSGILQTNTAVYETNTGGGGGRVVMQGDGNVVAHRAWGDIQFASGSEGNIWSYLAMQPDGNLCAYNYPWHGWGNATWCYNPRDTKAGGPYAVGADGGSIALLDKDGTRRQ
jgi:hypothetical protein